VTFKRAVRQVIEYLTYKDEFGTDVDALVWDGIGYELVDGKPLKAAGIKPGETAMVEIETDK